MTIPGEKAPPNGSFRCFLALASESGSPTEGIEIPDYLPGSCFLSLNRGQDTGLCGRWPAAHSLAVEIPPGISSFCRSSFAVRFSTPSSSTTRSSPGSMVRRLLAARMLGEIRATSRCSSRIRVPLRRRSSFSSLSHGRRLPADQRRSAHTRRQPGFAGRHTSARQRHVRPGWNAAHVH